MASEFESTLSPAPASTKAEAAATLLRKILKDGPVPVARINQIMLTHKIGAKTAQRARHRIGAVQGACCSAEVFLRIFCLCVKPYGLHSPQGVYSKRLLSVTVLC